jgi:hypothetical protein
MCPTSGGGCMASPGTRPRDSRASGTRSAEVTPSLHQRGLRSLEEGQDAGLQCTARGGQGRTSPLAARAGNRGAAAASKRASAPAGTWQAKSGTVDRSEARRSSSSVRAASPSATWPTTRRRERRGSPHRLPPAPEGACRAAALLRRHLGRRPPTSERGRRCAVLPLRGPRPAAVRGSSRRSGNRLWWTRAPASGERPESPSSAPPAASAAARRPPPSGTPPAPVRGAFFPASGGPGFWQRLACMSTPHVDFVSRAAGRDGHLHSRPCLASPSPGSRPCCARARSGLSLRRSRRRSPAPLRPPMPGLPRPQRRRSRRQRTWPSFPLTRRPRTPRARG